jgi:mannose-1-phosphate guanylyltransferase/mannose-6-phosphate isomerase
MRHPPALPVVVQTSEMIQLMCGGAGTRLWPVSRDSMPKQFILPVGRAVDVSAHHALLSDPGVFGRRSSSPTTITVSPCAISSAAIGVSAEIVLEPARRDSAAGRRRRPSSRWRATPRRWSGVFAADHVMQDGAQFVATCAGARSRRRGAS